MARWLGVAAALTDPPRAPLDFEPADRMQQEVVEMTIAPGAAVVGKKIVHLRLPPGVLIVLLSRYGEFLIPHGGTVLEAGDTLRVLGVAGELARVRTLLEAAQPSAPHAG